MAVDTSADKKNYISKLQGYCATVLDTLNLATQLRQEAIDKGYQPGGADGITDAFLQTASGTSAAPFPQLAAADLTAAFAAIADLNTQLAATTRTDFKAMEKLRP